MGLRPALAQSLSMPVIGFLTAEMLGLTLPPSLRAIADEAVQ